MQCDRDVVAAMRRRRLSPCRPFPLILLLCIISLSVVLAAADQGKDTPILPSTIQQQDQQQYNATLAKLMVELCGCAYCCINDCSAWTCETCKKHPTLNVTELHSARMYDGHGFVAHDPPTNTIYVAFTGTDPLTLVDYFDDIDFLKAPYPGCEGCLVHRGFYLDWMELRDEVLGAVQGYYHHQQQQLGAPSSPSPRIQVTGHSLGGTLAVYAALDVIGSLGSPVDALITFGQPRMGNAAFRDFVHATITASSCAYLRVTHHRDPIVHLPGIVLGFHHAGQEIFYLHPTFRGTGGGNGGGGVDDYIVCRNSTNRPFIWEDDPNCSAQYVVNLNMVDHLTYLGFPFTENYIACNLVDQEKHVEERQMEQAKAMNDHQRLLLRGQEKTK